MSHPDSLQDYEPMDGQGQGDFEAWADEQDPFEEPHNTNYAAYLMEDSDNHINNGDILLRHMEAGTSWDDYLEEVFFKKGTK